MIKMIVAASRVKLGIGIDQRLPWKLKADLAFFKRTTQGSAVIMGRKTYESLPKALPNRLNVVLTSRTTAPDKTPQNVVFVNSVEKAIDVASAYSADTYVIGGASVYEAFSKYAEELILTEVSEYGKVRYDTHLTIPNPERWCISELVLQQSADENNDYDFRILRLVPNPSGYNNSLNVYHRYLTFPKVLSGAYKSGDSPRKVVVERSLYMRSTAVPFKRTTLSFPPTARTFSPYYLKELLPKKQTFVGPLTEHFNVLLDTDNPKILTRAYDAIRRALLLNNCTIV